MGFFFVHNSVTLWKFLRKYSLAHTTKDVYARMQGTTQITHKEHIMSIALKPSRNWPGRTELIFRTRPESSMSTAIPLSSEDIEELVKQLTEAGHIKPQVVEQEEKLAGVRAVADDLQKRGDAIDEHGHNGSIYGHEAAGRGIGYREAARNIYKALEESK